MRPLKAAAAPHVLTVAPMWQHESKVARLISFSFFFFFRDARHPDS